MLRAEAKRSSASSRPTSLAASQLRVAAGRGPLKRSVPPTRADPSPLLWRRLGRPPIEPPGDRIGTLAIAGRRDLLRRSDVPARARVGNPRLRGKSTVRAYIATSTGTARCLRFRARSGRPPGLRSGESSASASLGACGACAERQATHPEVVLSERQRGLVQTLAQPRERARCASPPLGDEQVDRRLVGAASLPGRAGIVQTISSLMPHFCGHGGVGSSGGASDSSTILRTRPALRITSFEIVARALHFEKAITQNLRRTVVTRTPSRVVTKDIPDCPENRFGIGVRQTHELRRFTSCSVLGIQEGH